MRLAVLHIPVGLTPEHLSKAISLQTSGGDNPSGLTLEVYILRAKSAKEW